MDAPTPALPRCRCGFDRTNPMVTAEPHYSIGGWLLMALGATPRPRRIVYRCSRCEQVLGSTRDPEALRKFA